MHLASELHGVAGFLAGRNRLTTEEWALPVNIDGRRVLHLRCHVRLDTLTIARGGAVVTSVGVSPVALAETRRLAAAAGPERRARVVECDLPRPDARLLERFDVVATSAARLAGSPTSGAGARWSGP